MNIDDHYKKDRILNINPSELQGENTNDLHVWMNKHWLKYIY